MSHFDLSLVLHGQYNDWLLTGLLKTMLNDVNPTDTTPDTANPTDTGDTSDTTDTTPSTDTGDTAPEDTTFGTTPAECAARSPGRFCSRTSGAISSPAVSWGTSAGRGRHRTICWCAFSLQTIRKRYTRA